MSQEQEVRIQQLEEENRVLQRLLRETCERFFRIVPLSCRLNADILDDWFRFAHELEALDLLPDKPGQKEE